MMGIISFVKKERVVKNDRPYPSPTISFNYLGYYSIRVSGVYYFGQNEMKPSETLYDIEQNLALHIPDYLEFVPIHKADAEWLIARVKRLEEALQFYNEKLCDFEIARKALEGDE